MSGSGRGGTPVASVRVDVLGPLRLIVGDDAVEVPGPKRRALLALLTMAEGRAVPGADLVDALWPVDVPDAARASLHSHVSRLRRHLAAAAPRLEGVAGGYRLRLDGSESGSDVSRARALLERARVCEADERRALLAEARQLWRGPALAEFSDVAPLAAWSVSLAELRRTVDEAYAAAVLDGGPSGEAIETASALVAADPSSEEAVLALMRALDAAGRRADALRAAHAYRRQLATETGLDPSDALVRLEREIAGRVVVRPGTVPRPGTRLRGRDSELAALHRLLETERLVTVLGPGGVGKTRLAVEVAARADQATALLLAPVTDPDAIPHALAGALDLHVVQGDVLASCAALLGAGPQLLLVDNCEHLRVAARHVVASLLDLCPELTVLATSREPLGLAAEQRLRIAPLPMTRSDGVGPDLAASPAAALFLERARAVRTGYLPTPDDLALIDQIVRRIDGIPLAIELAASRIASLNLGDLHARLDRSLDLLGDGDRSLRQTLGWSYELLPEDEQRIFRHLAMVPDGFDLETAEAIGETLDIGRGAASAVAHLVDASMVELAPDEGARYRMLDTMRSFARDQLDVSGETVAAGETFLRWAVDLVDWIDRTVPTENEALADRRLRRELGNLRAAWRMARDEHRLDDAVRLASGLADAAGWRDVTEVWGWLLELVEDADLESHERAAAVLGLAAGCAWARGELDRADRLVAAGLRRGGGDQPCLAAAAMVALSRGNLVAARSLGQEAAELAVRPDQSLGIAALAAAYQGELDAAATLAEQLAARAESPTIEGFAHYVAGEIDALAGRNAVAESRYADAIALTRQSGASFIDGIASVGLQTVRARAGRISDALDGYEELIEYWERTGGWIQQWTTLRNLAQLLRTLGEDESACFLECAASSAPDAPPDSAVADSLRARVSADARAKAIAAEAASASRARVLEVACQSIARQRAASRRSSVVEEPVSPSGAHRIRSATSARDGA